MISQQNRVDCLICGSDLEPGADVVAHELIECDECGSEFEVTATSPLNIIEAPLEEEDWGE